MGVIHSAWQTSQVRVYHVAKSGHEKYVINKKN